MPRIGNAITRRAGRDCASISKAGMSTANAERIAAVFAPRSRKRQQGGAHVLNGVRRMRQTLLPVVLSAIVLAGCTPDRGAATTETDATAPPAAAAADSTPADTHPA